MRNEDLAQGLLGTGVALILLVIGYFGMGYVVYDKLGNVKSSRRIPGRRPDNLRYPKWPAGFVSRSTTGAL